MSDCPARAINADTHHIYRCTKPAGHTKEEHIAPPEFHGRYTRWKGRNFVFMPSLRPRPTPLDLALEDRYQPDSAAFRQGWVAACQTVIADLTGSDAGANYERAYSFGDAANMVEGLMESTSNEARAWDALHHRAIVALHSDAVRLRNAAMLTQSPQV